MQSVKNTKDLLNRLESSGCVPEDLDGMINELALNLADSITNDGFSSQISFVMDTCGIEFDEMLELISDYIDLEELLEEEE